jgi:hypothetical protein
MPFKGALTLSFMVLGPLCALLLSIIARVAFWPQDLGEVSRLFSRPSLVGPMLLVFYLPGLPPALVTGLLTEWHMKRHGHCPALRSAVYGSLSSIGISAIFLLFVPMSYANPSSVPVILASKALLGFLATFPVWWLTRGLQQPIGTSAADR